MQVKQYLLHGVRLETRTDSPVVAEALTHRLRYFAAEGLEPPHCRLDLCLAPPGVQADHDPLTAGRTQLLVQEEAARVEYNEPEDVMYLSYRDGLTATIHGTRSYAQIRIPEGAVECFRRLKHAVLMLPLMELLRPHGLYNTHAAGLAVEGKGLLFPAESGSGKTTLTLALARAGFGFLSDDLVFLKQEGERVSMHAFADDVDLTEETVRLFPEVAPQLRAAIPGCPKRQVSVPEAFPAKVVMQCPPAAVICPRIAHADRTRLEPLSPLEAFLDFTGNLTLARPQTAQAHLNVIGALLRQVPCYRMHTGRDLAAVPGLLRELVS